MMNNTRMNDRPRAAPRRSRRPLWFDGVVLWIGTLLLVLSSLPCAVVAQTTTTTTTTQQQRQLQDDNEGINLGGSVVTRTNVQRFADLSQDVAEIRRWVLQQQPAEALRVYQQGHHAQQVEPGGVPLSLSHLADELVAAHPKTPSFLFHLYGQAHRQLNVAFLDSNQLSYVNHQVQQTLTNHPEFAVEAVWILNTWMYATHLLFQGVLHCRQNVLADLPSSSSSSDVGGMAGWDAFIALWIGSGQQPGASNGDSLYAWAQLQAEAMGTFQSSSSPEAPVNTRLKLLYQEAVTLLSAQNSCSTENEASLGRLWQLVMNAVSEMSKPLFQGFLRAIHNQQGPLVDLYATALVPQLSKCRPSLYKTMHEEFVAKSYSTNPNIDNFPLDTLIPDLAFCFGYSCEELGRDTSVTGLSSCEEFDVFRPTMAGYIPQTEVGNVAAADLDVYQIQILASLNSNIFAELLYMNGANIAKYRDPGTNDPLDYVSLHDIAISGERSSAQPYFDIYVDYHNEKDYGDKVVRQALGGSSKWAASQQVAAIVGTTAAYQILFLEAITKLKIAVQECREADPVIGVNPTLNPIDEAAALLIGSMEGAKLGGSSDLEDGQLIYNIANRHAFQFNTINTELYANSVGVLEDLLFAARGELDGLACSRLEQTTEDILRYSMVGITQACVQLTVNNEQLGSYSTAKGLAEAEGLTLAILPLIDNVSPSIAGQISDIMIRDAGDETVDNGAAWVAQLFGQGFTDATNLQCHKNLGSIQSVDPCNGVACTGDCNDGSGSGGPRLADHDNTTWGAAIAAVLLLVGGGLLLYRNREFTRDIREYLEDRRNENIRDRPAENLPKYPPRNPPPRLKRSKNNDIV